MRSYLRVYTQQKSIPVTVEPISVTPENTYEDVTSRAGNDYVDGYITVGSQPKVSTYRRS